MYTYTYIHIYICICSYTMICTFNYLHVIYSMMLSDSITICTFNQHSHFSFLTSTFSPFFHLFHLPAGFFSRILGSGCGGRDLEQDLGIGRSAP